MKSRYVDWNGHPLLAETYCFCGKTLTAMGMDPRVHPISRELPMTTTRTIIRETFVSRLPTSDFATIEFEVEEERTEVFVPEANEVQDAHSPRIGLHVSTVCKSCKKELTDGVHDIADVQKMYDEDCETSGLPKRKVLRVIG